MATYAIGDIQGCYSDLRSLLDRIHFQQDADQLWFVGDLVNRGPASLETLRFVKSLGDSAITVLGNHDIHLIACFTGAQACKKSSTLRPILEAPDCTELIDWLRYRPLLHTDPLLGYTMVHAGLLPQWDLTLASQCAFEVETILRSQDYVSFFQSVYGDAPDRWNDSLNGVDRYRVIVNGFTRLRFCDRHGGINLDYKGPVGSQPEGLIPWYAFPERRSSDISLIFGHWSALGLHMERNVTAIDTGCLWGGALTAVRIDVTPIEVFQVPCSAKKSINAGGPDR